MKVPSQKSNNISKGSEAREDRVGSENVGAKVEGKPGARYGVNGRGLLCFLGPGQGCIGGMGTPPSRKPPGDTTACCPGLHELGSWGLGEGLREQCSKGGSGTLG